VGEIKDAMAGSEMISRHLFSTLAVGIVHRQIGEFVSEESPVWNTWVIVEHYAAATMR
jgi:hypothetical protein